MDFNTATYSSESEPPAHDYAVPPRLVPTVPFVSYGLIALNVLVYVAMVVRGISPTSPESQQMIAWGADFGPLTLSGEWWRLFTSCFLHFGIIHIAMNMFVFYQVGPFTERLFGNVRFLVLYLVAGLGGNVLGLYFHPLSVAAGASGAIFGIYGGLLGFLLIQRGVIAKEGAMRIAKSAAIFIFYNLVYGLASPGTDLTAHGGGLATGFFAGCCLALPLIPHDAAKSALRAVTVALGAGIVAYFAISHLGGGKAITDWDRLLLTSPRVTVGKEDVIVYSGTATKKEAEAIGDVLVKVNILSKPDITLLWNRTSAANTLSIPMRDDATSKPAWDDQRFIDYMQNVGGQVAPAAGGPPFSIRLLNGKGEVKREIPITNAP